MDYVWGGEGEDGVGELLRADRTEFSVRRHDREGRCYDHGRGESFAVAVGRG